MNKTKIEWALNPDGTPGYTWNPITGCLNGCPYCYARRLANTRLRERYLANNRIHTQTEYGIMSRETFHGALANPFYPRFWPEKISGELNQRSCTRGVKAKGIFVCDMSDLFGIGIPEEWTRQVLDKIRMRSYHRFYLLTKQPQNLQKFSPFPDNCWVGVSVTKNSQVTPAFEGLSNIEAKVKYLSLEPLLERIGERNLILISQEFMTWFDWLIIGAQTKPTVLPKIEWVKEIVEACDKAGVKVFLKDNLKPLLPPEVPTFYTLKLKVWHDDGEPEYDPILRQELPHERT